MKKIFLPAAGIAIALFLSLFAQAQSGETRQSPIFNHTTIYVTDLQKSSLFYYNVMQLDSISEPFMDGRHTWFGMGPHNQLHVVGGSKAIIPHDINIHLSFTVKSLPDFMAHLDKWNVQYGNWKRTSKDAEIRPDGIKQIYFQDPDGYWIEVNNSTY